MEFSTNNIIILSICSLNKERTNTQVETPYGIIRLLKGKI